MLGDRKLTQDSETGRNGPDDSGEALARRKTTRKAAKSTGKGWFAGSWGWIAAAALGVGWLAADGRPAAYGDDLVASLQKHLARPAAASNRAPSHQASIAKPPTTFRPERSGNGPPAPVFPSRHEALPPASVPVAVKTRVPGPEAPRGPAAPGAGGRSVQPPSSAGAHGGTRHATRPLPVRSRPDGASPVVATIEASATVAVSGAAGSWRYVRDGRRDVEGWVDGTYLAGEAGSVVPASSRLRADAAPSGVDGDRPKHLPPLGIGPAKRGGETAR